MHELQINIKSDIHQFEITYNRITPCYTIMYSNTTVRYHEAVYHGDFTLVQYRTWYQNMTIPVGSGAS